MNKEEIKDYITQNMYLYEPTCKEVYDFADDYLTHHHIKISYKEFHKLYEAAAQKTDRISEYMLEHLIDDNGKSYFDNLYQSFVHHLANQCIIYNLDLYKLDADIFIDIADDESRLIAAGLLDPSEYLTEKAWCELLGKYTITA